MIELSTLLLVYGAMLALATASSYKGNLLCPQIIFVLGFFIQACYAFNWIEAWNLSLSATTMAALILGSCIYTLASIALQHIFLRNSRTDWVVNEKCSIISNKISVDTWKLILFAIIQLITLGWCVLCLRRLIGGSFSEAIYYYHRNITDADSDVRLPFLLGIMRAFTKNSGFFWAYILVHSVVFRYAPQRILLFVNISLSFLINIVLGGRGGATRLLISALVMFYVLMQFRTGWKFRLKTGTLLKILAITSAIAMSFSLVGTWLGRNITQSREEYLAIYLSAELKNLDTFVRAGDFGRGSSMDTTMVFQRVANLLSGKFGFPDWQHDLVYPVQFVNGHALGNVTTTFYAFLYDGGFTGLVGFTFLMALITTYLYGNMYKRTSDALDIGIIVYAYIVYDVFFCFFADKVFENIVAKGFLYAIITFWVLKVFVKLNFAKEAGSRGMH